VMTPTPHHTRPSHRGFPEQASHCLQVGSDGSRTRGTEAVAESPLLPFKVVTVKIIWKDRRIPSQAEKPVSILHISSVRQIRKAASHGAPYSMGAIRERHQHQWVLGWSL
jgi:hypothetical protein